MGEMLLDRRSALIGGTSLALTAGLPFAARATDEPRRGGVLVVQTYSDLKTLNPAMRTSYAIHVFTSKMIEPLVDLGPNNEPVPKLAVSWDSSADGKTITFKPTATRFGFMILVNDDNPATTLPELTAQLKQKGGGLYGASSTNMLAAAEMYKFSAGLDTQQVLYKSTADSVRDLASKQIDFAVVDAAFALAQAKTNHVRPLAITLPRRSVLAPEVPTMEEAGLKDYEVSGWMALAAPAATPAPILGKAHSWMAQIMAMPETTKFILDLGFEPFYVPPTELKTFQETQIEK